MVEIKSGIYSITNKINGKRYVGSAVNFKERWRKHIGKLKKNKSHCFHLQSAWNKWGEENFKFEILCHVENKNKLLKIEQIFLDLYQSYDRRFGYNTCHIAGSNLGRKMRTESRKKISEAKKGNKNMLGHKHTEESKKKISESLKGKKSWNKGMKMSEKFCIANSKSHLGQSAWNKGMKMSEEFCRHNSEAQKGRKHTEETKKKMSEAHKARNLMKKS